MKRAPLSALIGALCLGAALPARADLPEWLRKHNGDVDTGNEALNKGDPKGAMESYGKAARVLPDAPGLMLDRGIAQLKQGDFAKSRESLLAATVPNASSDVRADAYHNLSLSFYREADGLAEKNHGDAQKMFRESVDAAKRSLHLRPSDPNTAWNLELASRRMREEEQKKKEEDEQKEKDKKDKDQQKQDQQNQDQNQDQQKDDQQKQDQNDQDQQNKDGQQDQKQDDQQKPEPDKNKPENQPQPDPSESNKDDAQKQDAPEQALPREAEQALDSLENNEENFERYRARQRANRERRAPEKDW